MNMNKKIWIIIYVILVFVFVLISLDFYLSRKHYAPSSNMILENPLKYGGKEFAFIGPVINASSSSFYMSVNHRPLKIYYKNLEKPVLGQIYVLATVNADGTVNALGVQD